MVLRRLFQLVFAAGAAVVLLTPQSPERVRAGPINFGLQMLNVTDFNADNTGRVDSTAAIQSAINSCSTASADPGLNGCEIHFAAGTYLVASTPMPSASGVLVLPANVPITLSGAGQQNTIILAYASAVPQAASYNIIYVQPTATAQAATAGYSIHDIGFELAPSAAPNGATSGSVIDIPYANHVDLYNLYFYGAYDAIELGQTDAQNNLADYTNVRAVSSSAENHCFLRLDGGISDLFVRSVYADANYAATSSVFCMPSLNGNGAGFGVTGLYLSDADFENFGRGISVPAYQLQFKNVNIDRVLVDAIDGPAFELFVPPGSISAVTNERVTNSILTSSSTACVIHGSVSLVKLVNDMCTGAQAAAVPSPCTTATGAASLFQRGYALIEVSGTPTGSETLSVAITPSAAPSVVVTYAATMSESAANIASGLGIAINASTLVSPALGSCPVLVPVQVFNDSPAPTTTHASIGQDVELYAFQYTKGATISVSPTGGSGATLSLPGIATTFAPGDGTYVGSPGASSTPDDVIVLGGASNVAVASNSTIYGAGLHLQGGSSLLFGGNNFASTPSAGTPTPTLYGVQVEAASTYRAVQVLGNNLGAAPIYFHPSPTSFPSPALYISGNAGLNPVGLAAPTPTPTCGTALINPFPYDAQVYVSGTFSSVEKNATVVFGSQTGGAVVVYLGPAETIRVNCSTTPTITWFGS